MSDAPGHVRWIVKAALVASLTANMGFAWILLRPQPVRMAQVAPLNALQAIAGRLNSKDAAVLRSAIEKRAGILRNAQQVYQSDVARVLDELARDPFDIEATRKAMEQARSQRSIAADALVEAVLEALPLMSPEGRAALTETTRRRASLPPP